MHCYIIISPAFKALHEGAVNGCNTFKTATLTDGRFVISTNALNEFPELFESIEEFDFIYLEASEFPQHDNNIL